MSVVSGGNGRIRNDLIDDLVHPTTETARVIGAVAQGDLSKTMALKIDERPLQGDFCVTAKTINTMVDQLGSFAAEVTRVAREVGTEGSSAGRLKSKTSRNMERLTDSVNMMAGNLTGQVRNMPKWPLQCRWRSVEESHRRC